MEWQKLELSKASLIKKEVDGVLSQLSLAAPNTAENPNQRSNLIYSIQSRIQELENFYIRNNDDERAILFEKERLRLRKALQTYHAANSKDAKSVATGVSISAASNDGLAHLVSSQSTVSNTKINSGNNSRNGADRSVTSNPTTPRVQRIVTPMGPKTIISSTASVASTTRKSPTSQNKIYAWEEPGHNNKTKDHLVIDNNVFYPTEINGFYNRAANGSPTGHNGEEAPVLTSDQFCDFQIVLTLEELTTLASRKRQDRADVKLHRNQAASMSVHSTTPYIEHRRIVKQMFRPTNPDKWINQDGMRAYRKN